MKILIIFFSFLVILHYQGCSEKAGFSSHSKGTSTTDTTGSDNNDNNTSHTVVHEPVVATPVDPRTPTVPPVNLNINDIKHSCKNSPNNTRVVTLRFPKPANTCDWGNNGNLMEKNGFFQARIEQKGELGLPANSIICDTEFDFAEQDFLYDDHFILLFNSSVIASSYNFAPQLDNGVNDLLQYDWMKLAGMNWLPEDELLYCPQIPGAESSCSFPGHDKAGTIELAYDPIYIQSIMANGLPEHHSFSMVSIGDNDAMDCEHSDIEFTVKVSYISN